MQIDAALLGTLPVRWNALVDVCLVDDLGDQLLAIAGCARVGGRKFAAQNGVFAASRNQQTEQCPDAVDCEAENDNGDKKKDGDASPHVRACCSSESSFLLVYLSVTQGRRESRAPDRDVAVESAGGQALMKQR